MTLDEHGRRWVVIVAVALLHVLFLLALLMRDGMGVIARSSMQAESVLFFVEDRPRPGVVPSQPVSVPSSQPSVRSEVPRAVGEPGDSAATGDAAADQIPPIDWSTQATQAASAAVDKAIQQETRNCDPSERPNSFLPPCKPRRHQFEWNPNASKVGFSGGLPFVRLGERCVVGLGFFGCGFGEKPPANGDLFEHMDDPERDRSSVPALEDAHSRRHHVPSVPGPDESRSDSARRE